MKNASDAEFQSEYQKSAVKLKAAEQQLKDFCKATNQQRDKFREQVLGFDKIQAQKAVWTEKKIENEFKSDYGEVVFNALTKKERYDIIKNKERLSNFSARKWYLSHDEKIPDLIDKTRSIEEQAHQACELRNAFRTITRDMMNDIEERKELDERYPNKTFEELLQDKMKRKGLTKAEAIEDILKTATNANVKHR